MLGLNKGKSKIICTQSFIAQFIIFNYFKVCYKFTYQKNTIIPNIFYTYINVSKKILIYNINRETLF